MLPASHRLTRGADLRRVSRLGRRAGSGSLVLYLLAAVDDLATAQLGSAGPGTRVGLVVGRAVGNSVVRHRVQRRLRHLCADRLDQLPAGADVVVRALPAAGAASSAELGADLDRCLRRVLHPGAGTVS